MQFQASQIRFDVSSFEQPSSFSKETLSKFFLIFFCSLGRLLFKVETLPCWWTTVATYHRQRRLVLISIVASREPMIFRISIILDIKACHCVIITSHSFPIFNVSVKWRHCSSSIEEQWKNVLFAKERLIIGERSIYCRVPYYSIYLSAHFKNDY